MENEDKYEPPTVLNDVTDTVTFNEIHDADVTGVSDKYPDVTDVSAKYPDVTDVSDTFPHVSDVNDKYPDVTDVSGNYSDEDESDKYNIGRDFDDGEVNESSSLTDEESEWTAKNESPLLSDEHDERDTTTLTQQSVKDLDNKRKRRKISKTARNVKQLESNVNKIRQEFEGIIERIVRHERRNALSYVILQIATTDIKICKKDQKKSCGIKKKGNEENSKNEISNRTFLFISDIFRSTSSDAASVIVKCLLKIDKITYPIKMFIQSRDSLSRLEYVRLVQFDTDIDREDPKYQPLKAIPTSPIEISSENTMVKSQLDTIKGTAQHTSELDDEDVGQQRSCGSPLIARTQNINMKSMICVVQYQSGFLVLAVFRGSAGGIQQTNVILITCEMIEFILNHNILSSVFNIPGAIPNVVECFNRWSCLNEISINFQRLVQFYKSSLKMSPENSRNRTGSSNFTFERQVQPSVDMIPIVRNAMGPPSFKQIDHSSMEPQERTNGHSLLIREPLTSSVMSVKKPDMNLGAVGGVRKRSRTKDRKHSMNRVKITRNRLVGLSLSDRSYTYMRKGIMHEEYCVANSRRKVKHYQKGHPDLNKGFFKGNRNHLSRDPSEYTESAVTDSNDRKVKYESKYYCESGVTDSNVSLCSYNTVEEVREEAEVGSDESLISNSRKGVISNGIEERCGITDIHNDDKSNPSSTRMQGHLLNTHPTEDTCETEMCTSVTHHPAYKKCNHVPYKTTRSIPPEGGTSGNVVLINTCCIDGVLLMIYTVLDYDHYHRNRFKDSDNELEKISFEVWNSFKENNFGIGKVMWCFCGGSVSLAEMNSGRQIRVDITGTENQRIFSVLGKHRLDVECRCTNQDCPYPVMKQTERYRVLPIYATERELLSDTISKGINNFLWRDMGLCTNSQSDGEKCSGTRRQSIVEPPFILPVNLYFLHFGGKTFNSSDIPEKVEHNNLIYDLRLVRFYRDKHFVDKIKVDGVWTYYDNGHGQLYYFDADLKGAELSTCYYIKRRQNL